MKLDEKGLRDAVTAWYRGGEYDDLKSERDDMRSAIEAYLKATNSVIVPVDVTDAMDDAFYDAHARSDAVFASTQELWSAMIQASQEFQE